MIKKLIVGLGAMTLMLAATLAQAVLINFESDANGSNLQDFVSNDAPFVTFRDTMGSNLRVDDYCCAQGNGKSLGVHGDDASKLEILVAGGATQISMRFGNDDPAYTSPGDRAWLQLYVGAALVHEHYFVLNRNDIMDQAIGKNGTYFDRAVFFYGDASGNAINLIEIVDDININGVPAPASLAFLMVGLVGLFSRRRQR